MKSMMAVLALAVLGAELAAALDCTDVKDGHLDLGSATTIRAHAFRECAVLKTVTGAHVRTIGPSAFWGCKALVSANFPRATTTTSSAFYMCPSLVSINLAWVTTVGSEVTFKSNTTAAAAPRIKDHIHLQNDIGARQGGSDKLQQGQQGKRNRERH